MPSPFVKGHKKMGGRTKGSQNKATLDMVEWFREFLSSPECRESMKRRMLSGKAPKLEELAFHYGLGKPVETVEVTGADGGAIMVQQVEAERAAGTAKARVLRLLKGGLSGNGADGNGGGARHAAG